MAEAPRIDPTNVPFESLLDRLGDVVTRLESGDLPLEAALGVFEEGIVLARAGARRLDEAERRVEQLLAEGDRLVTRPLAGAAATGSAGSPRPSGSGSAEENVE